MNNLVFGKTVENLRNRIEQRKRVLKWMSKSSYISRITINVWHDLVDIRKSKVTL